MHHRVLSFVCVGTVALAVLPVQASEWFPRAATQLQAPPATPTMFASLAASTPSEAVSLTPSLRLGRSFEPGDPATPGSTSSKGRYFWPAFASALLPGTGEISTGHIWNGIPLLAAEVAIWVGWKHYDDQGHQLRSDYEALADAHWSYDRWQGNLRQYYDVDDPNTPPPNWYNEDFPYKCDCSPPYIPKEEDPQEYYENAGKYRHFWPGWTDWVYNPDDPVHSDSQAIRAQYIGLRNSSNDAFDNRGTMLGLAVLTRVISVAQTLWLVKRDADSDLRFQPTYSRRKGAGMKVTLRY